MSTKPLEGKRAGRCKLQEMKDALDDKEDEVLRWEGGLSGWHSVGEVWSGPVISPRMWLKYLIQMMIKKIKVFFGSFSNIPAFCLYTVPGIKVINQYYKK